VILREPRGVQGEATAQQRLAATAGVAQVDVGLAIVRLTGCPAPLAGDTDGVAPLLGHVAPIDDEDAVVFAQRLIDRALMSSQDHGIVPRSLTDELLEASWLSLSELFGSWALSMRPCPPSSPEMGEAVICVVRMGRLAAFALTLIILAR